MRKNNLLLLLTVFLAVSVIALILIGSLGGGAKITVDESIHESDVSESEISFPSSDTSKADTSEPSSGQETSGPEVSVDESKETSVPTEESVPAEESFPPEESEEPSIPPVQEDTVISFLACPDNLIHPSVYYSAIVSAAEKAGKAPVYSPLASVEYDFSDTYRFVAKEIKNADIAYINCETLIGGNENGISGYPMFNSPEAMGEYLVDLGFDVFNVAHNHMLDSGNDKYLINCNKFYTDRGGTVIGYYKDKDSIDDIVVYEYKGVKIAWLAYTYDTNGITLKSSASTYIPYFDEALIRRQYAAARAKADLVFVSAHWGYEDSYYTNADQRKYAALFTELGVDAVIGMHSHCIQPVEWQTNASGHKTLVVYSLGNFVSGMLNGLNMLGGMLRMDIVKDGATGKITLENVEYVPTVTQYDKSPSLNSTDSGYRHHTIYYLKDYTEELASKHYIRTTYEKAHGTTLIGGEFSKANLVKTVQTFIKEEFLDECFHK